MAKTVKPCLRTQWRNHSTTPRATMNETHDADDEHDPALGVHDDVRHGRAGSGFAGVNLFDQVPTGGGHHGGNGEQEAELEGGGTVEAGELPGGDGGHGARGAGKDGREGLAEADPDGLEQVHLLHVGGFGSRRSDQASMIHMTMPPMSRASAMALRLPSSSRSTCAEQGRSRGEERRR